MAKAMAKRFYDEVTVEEIEGSWAVLLDGKQLRTPGKLKLSLPSKALAKRISAEWEAQVDRINPSVMPVTRLANVAIEQTPENRPLLVAEARRYAETDLLCFRAPQPRILKDRQSAAWDSWLEWATDKGIVLETTETLQAVTHPVKSLDKVERFAASLDDLRLTLFVHLIAVYGSVILAKAVMLGALVPEEAFDLSRLDNDYQIELWGEDEEQAEITSALRKETIALGEILECL